MEIQRAKEKESKKVNENSDENGDNSVIKETPGVVPEQPNDDDKMDISNEEDSSTQSDADDKDDLSLEEKRAKAYLVEETEGQQQSDNKTDEDQFNSFVYWRDPLLSLEELEFKEKLTDSLNKLQIEKDEDENEEAAGNSNAHHFIFF